MKFSCKGILLVIWKGLIGCFNLLKKFRLSRWLILVVRYDIFYSFFFFIGNICLLLKFRDKILR